MAEKPKNRPFRRTLMMAVPLALAVTLVAACGSSSKGPQAKTSGPTTGGSTPPAAHTSMTFSLDFRTDGLHAPVYVAKDSGLYSAQGLDVSIEPSGGSQDSITRVAAGQAQMGFADAGTVVKAIAAQHLPIIVVGMLLKQTPTATVALKSSGITTPADLKGKTVGDAPATSEHAFFPAFLKHAGLTASEVSTVALSPAAIVPELIAKKVDAVNIYEQVFAKYADQVTFIPWDQYGLTAYGTTIIASTSFASAHPAAVKAFLKATYQGLASTLSDPSQAANDVASAAGGTPSAYFLSELQILKPFWTTTNGSMTADLWNKTQSLNLQYAGQTSTVPLAQIYTDQYLP